MIPCVPGRWQRQAAGVCVLLGVCLFAPAAARGSCGNYVIRGADQPGHAAEASPALPVQASTLPHLPGPLPCSGEGCSQGPSVPPQTSTPPPPSGSDFWACETGQSAVLAAEVAGTLASPVPLSPVRRPTAPYRPPR